MYQPFTFARGGNTWNIYMREKIRKNVADGGFSCKADGMFRFRFPFNQLLIKEKIVTRADFKRHNLSHNLISKRFYLQLLKLNINYVTIKYLYIFLSIFNYFLSIIIRFYLIINIRKNLY